MGPSEVVVTDNDPELPRREAKRLADMLWATRDQLVAGLTDFKPTGREPNPDTHN